MTGHGDACLHSENCTVTVELRSVNNRHFKLSVKGADGLPGLESQIEELIRDRIQRGSVYANLRLEFQDSQAEIAINRSRIEAYRRQLGEIFGDQAVANLGPATLLQLPGVLPECWLPVIPAEKAWPLIREAVTVALEQLVVMRMQEGAAMERDLRTNCQALIEELARIGQRAPQVLDGYRQRLIDRVQHFLQTQGLSLSPGDVVKEVALFADRGDISEEIVRLQAHVDQLLVCLQGAESVGRKLDFLTQEMFREANTIGSKANDAETAHLVVNMKNRIERLREMVQNVE
jgi:uncharacterized protein (TIGR00255 family)